MAATVGRDGGVVVNGSTITFIDRWGLSASVGTDDVTSFGDTTQKNVQTIKSWSADIEGTLDRSNAQQAALLSQFEDGALADVVLQLKTAPSAYWYGSAVLKSATVRSAVGSKVSVSFSFMSSGKLSYYGS